MRSYIPLQYFLKFLLVFLSTFSLAVCQITVTSPSTSVELKPCDDFATQVIGNAWDMNSSTDVNNFFKGNDIQGLGSISFTNGLFSGVSNSASPLFYLFSPQACGSYPLGGKWGQNYSLNTADYSTLSFKMFIDKADPQGLRLIWDRSCNYASTRTVTLPYPTEVGWHTYSVALNSLNIDQGSTSKQPWISGSITGFAVLPAVLSGANIKFDWIRLENPNTCEGSSVAYTVSSVGNNDLGSIWIDDDTNPFNGFNKLITKASTGSNEVSYTTLGMAPGEYYVVSHLDSDFRTLEYGNPWDMTESTDVSTQGIPGASFVNGTLQGVASPNQNIYLDVGTSGINASKYSRLSLGLSTSDSSQKVRIIWTNTNNASGFIDLDANNLASANVYQYNLSSLNTWTGTIKELIIQPTIGSAVSFTLDFVSLRKSGYDLSRDADVLKNSVTVATQKIIVGTPPELTIIEPDERGGEAIRPWNMRSGDMVVYDNLLKGNDPSFPGEKYVSFLPDVRLVDGIRGDFFKGTNDPDDRDSDDAVNYSLFPFRSDSFTFSSQSYHNLCFKLLIDRDFDLGLGSVARVIWKAVDGDFKNTEDLALIYDNWKSSRWYEYCADMNKVPLENTSASSWEGEIEAFRVDPHEFRLKTSYYFDSIKLRKDETTTTGKFEILYNLVDNDSSNAQVSFYYTNNPEAVSGGTLIGTGSKSSRRLTWNTLGVPNGTYYLYGVASDTQNSVTYKAKGPVIVQNGLTKRTATPVLSLASPRQNSTVCETLPVHGYALLSDIYQDVAAVEVLVDGNMLGTIFQNDFIYSPEAILDHPLRDSSNAGFSLGYNISSLSSGEHTVLVRALSTDGLSTEVTRTVTKGQSNCAELPITASPAGTPIAVDDTLLEEAEPTSITTPVVRKVSLSKKGLLSITLDKVAEDGFTCDISVNVGAKKNALSLANTFTPTQALITLQAKGILIQRAKLKQFLLNVTKTCGSLTATSANRKVRVKNVKGKIKSIKGLLGAFKKKLKIS
jgi:hypothetical protein